MKILLLLLLPCFCKSQTVISKDFDVTKIFDTVIFERNRYDADSLPYMEKLRQERDFWKNLYYLKTLPDMPDSIGRVNDSTFAYYFIVKPNEQWKLMN